MAFSFLGSPFTLLYSPSSPGYACSREIKQNFKVLAALVAKEPLSILKVYLFFLLFFSSTCHQLEWFEVNDGKRGEELKKGKRDRRREVQCSIKQEGK